MAKYDEPSAGHKTALRQLGESRKQVLELIRQLDSTASGTAGPHPNLTPVSEAPTARTMATASLADYVLQLRPYRHQSNAWHNPIGSLSVPKRFATPKPADPSADRFFTLVDDAQLELESLSDLMDLAGRKMTYRSQKVGKNNIGFDTRVYLFSLTPSQTRSLFAAADDVAREGDFLADLSEPDTEDTAGW